MALTYTGSPLGLIPDLGFVSGSDKAYPINEKGQVGSIFSSSHKILARKSPQRFVDPLSFADASTTHDDSVYDVSTKNILDQLDGIPSMKLKPADFIYAQDYGVYPNNRLIVCRRFGGPCGDDLTRTKVEPKVSLVSWFADEEPPVSFDFGETWQSSNEKLKDILNDFGKDVSSQAADRAGLGGILSRLGDGIPLPGITEVLQRRILGNLGIIGPGASKLPSGDPNLIMESSKRRLVSMDQPGSGLTGKIKVTVNCKWEQKFIAGVDPTLVYYDILRTILSFGGSNATFYLGASGAASGVSKFLDDLATKPFELISGFVGSIMDGLKDIIDGIQKLFTKGKPPDDDKQKEEGGLISGVTQGSINKFKLFLDIGGSVFKDILKNVTYKYKIRIMAVMNYLTGSPSGPWHVTIGNPMRPILSCGDMITSSSVNVKLGPTLAFNDLPSTIECSFTLESARNLGIDEIFGKLSCGKLRVTKKLKTPIEVVTLNDQGDESTELVSNVEVPTSLDDKTFYNSNGELTELEFEPDVADASAQSDSQGDDLQDPEVPTKVDGEAGNQFNSDANNGQQQDRGSFEIGGSSYNYVFSTEQDPEDGTTVSKITVTDQSGKVVTTNKAKNNSFDPSLQSVEQFLIEVSQNEISDK
jgi:hypothetical protein